MLRRSDPAIPAGTVAIRALEAAVLAHRCEDLPAAEAEYRRALHADRDLVDALQGLAIVRLQRGAADEAARLLRRALRHRPDVAGTHNMLGLALAALDRHDSAIAHYQRALLLDPGLAGAHDNFGLSLMALQQPAAALEHYRQALALRPGRAALLDHVGSALTALGRYHEALETLAEALARDPALAMAYFHLGNVLHALDRRDEALAAYRCTLALAPDFPEAHANSGLIFEELGQLDEARAAFERAIAQAPHRAQFYHCLADYHRFGRNDPYVKALERLARDITTVPLAERPHVHFALGKAYADSGAYEASFRHLVAGNALHRARVAYDETAVLGLLDRTRRIFSKALIEQSRGLGDPSSLPVFIIGMPRSGTTLVEQILAGHHQIFAAGERDALPRQAMQLDPAYPEAMTAISDEALRRFGADYIRELAAAAPAALRVTDKLPGNFRFVGLIHLVLPQARIIHVRRDPVDTCFSCFSKLFTGAQPFAYELGELGRYYRAYRTLMEHWRSVLPPETMLEIDYEALVADLPTQARRIVAYCGLPWDPSCLDFHRQRHPVKTASALQVRQPLYSSAIGRSQPYRQWLAPLLDELGDAGDA